MYVSAEPSRREHQIDQRIDKIRSINLSLTYIYIHQICDHRIWDRFAKLFSSHSLVSEVSVKTCDISYSEKNKSFFFVVDTFFHQNVCK